MEYLKNYIQSITSSMLQVGADIEPELKSVPLAGLVETTMDSATLHQEGSATIYTATVGTGEMILVETGEYDVLFQMVAYLLVVETNSLLRVSRVHNLLTRMLTFTHGQRWGLNNTEPADLVECADLHGLSKGFKPDTSSWRRGVPVLAHAADLYGDDQPNNKLAIWAVTWEQKLRVEAFPYAIETDGFKPPEKLISKINDEILINDISK